MGINPVAAKDSAKRPTCEDLLDTMRRAHRRITGVMGICNVPADKAGGDLFADCALRETGHSLDDIAGDLRGVLSAKARNPFIPDAA